MTYVVSARRWRPQTFEDLVGQEHVTRTLVNALQTGRVAHAFLLTGVRGVGKTTVARILAKALNCEQGLTPTPCNSCTNCREIAAGSAVDVLEIDGASNTGVDDVREIIENVRYSPAKSRFKIYIIDEVHMLSNSAFNALLKTLEEPPAHVKFIFATTDPHKLPATVQSRCQRYDFGRIPLRLVAARLRRIADEEGVRISDRALALLAREGEGSMRDAQSLLDQVLACGGKEITDEDVLATLGIADRKVIYDLGEAIIAGDAARAIRLVNDLYGQGYEMRRLARDLVEYFRNLAVAQVAGGDLLVDLPDEEREAVRRQAARIDTDRCDRMFRVLLETDEEMGRSSHAKLLLEMALIKVASLPPLIPLQELVDRIEEIEGRLRAKLPGGTGGTGQAAARGRATIVRTSEGNPKQPRPPRVPAPEAAPEASARPDWRAFVSSVESERPVLAHHLGLCDGGLLDTGVLNIAAPAGFHYEFLAQPGQVSDIERLAQVHFGRPVKVQITSCPRREPETGGRGRAAEPSRAEVTDRALGNPAVKAAVEILGGEIQEVRPRLRRREKK